MGNINEAGAQNVVDLIDKNFLNQARPLEYEEIPRLRSLKIPTKAQAQRIFGEEVGERSIPIVLEEVAYSESEENHAVEIILQAGAEHELGYEGIALIELISQMAYNSAYNQLRTKEQLGKFSFSLFYIVLGNLQSIIQNPHDYFPKNSRIYCQCIFSKDSRSYSRF